MAKQPARVVNVSINAVALENHVDSLSLDVDQETPEVTAFNDVGPKRVVDNYDFGLDLDGGADFAAGQSDATLFALIANAGVAMDVSPTGNTAGANDPHYTGTVVLSKYGLSSKVGSAVTYKAALKGNSALTRQIA